MAEKPKPFREQEMRDGYTESVNWKEVHRAEIEEIRRLTAERIAEENRLAAEKVAADRAAAEQLRQRKIAAYREEIVKGYIRGSSRALSLYLHDYIQNNPRWSQIAVYPPVTEDSHVGLRSRTRQVTANGPRQITKASITRYFQAYFSSIDPFRLPPYWDALVLDFLHYYNIEPINAPVSAHPPAPVYAHPPAPVYYEEPKKRKEGCLLM